MGSSIQVHILGVPPSDQRPPACKQARRCISAACYDPMFGNVAVWQTSLELEFGLGEFFGSFHIKNFKLEDYTDRQTIER